MGVHLRPHAYQGRVKFGKNSKLPFTIELTRTTCRGRITNGTQETGMNGDLNGDPKTRTAVPNRRIDRTPSPAILDARL